MQYKHDYDKILTRLTTILSKLNDGEELSVKELAQEFNVSTRTIQRDLNNRLISFPIYQENKRWKIQDGYRVEKTKSLEDEIVLDIIGKIIEGIGGRFSIKAKNLLSKIKNDNFSPIYAKLNIEDIGDKLKDIQLIEKAIKNRLQVECFYDNEQHTPYKTILKPLKIANYEGFWYLIALQEETLKKYYLKNISNAKLTNKLFQDDKELEELLKNSISIWFQDDIEPFEVKLYADKTATKYFKRRPLPSQSIESLSNDGTMKLAVKITHEMEIIPIVKYWIPHLRVIEPKWVRNIIDEDLREYLSQT